MDTNAVLVDCNELKIKVYMGKLSREQQLETRLLTILLQSVIIAMKTSFSLLKHYNFVLLLNILISDPFLFVASLLSSGR